MKSNVRVGGVSKVAFDLKDTSTLLKKLKILAKEDLFDKEDLLKKLGI